MPCQDSVCVDLQICRDGIGDVNAALACYCTEARPCLGPDLALRLRLPVLLT